MAFINTVDVIGDEEFISLILSRDITEMYDNYVTSIGSHALSECKSLTIVDVPNCKRINTYAFYNSGLTTLVLRSDTLVTTTANAFDKTPIKTGTGYIYVPRALVDSYKTDTNWSTYANQIRAIEDYPEICG